MQNLCLEGWAHRRVSTRQDCPRCTAKQELLSHIGTRKKIEKIRKVPVPHQNDTRKLLSDEIRKTRSGQFGKCTDAQLSDWDPNSCQRKKTIAINREGHVTGSLSTFQNMDLLEPVRAHSLQALNLPSAICRTLGRETVEQHRSLLRRIRTQSGASANLLAVDEMQVGSETWQILVFSGESKMRKNLALHQVLKEATRNKNCFCSVQTKMRGKEERFLGRQQHQRQHQH